MNQKDVTDEKYESMNQLTEHDREVKIIITNKPRWAKDEATFHFYSLQDVSTGHTMQVQQTITTETMWREAQRVIGLMDKEAKLESIQVPLDMLGNIEELTSTNVGPHPFGELAKQHRKITIRTQKTVQLKEQQAGNSQAKLFGATVKAGSRSAQNSETSQESHRKKGRNDPTRSGQPTDEQDKGSQNWHAVERHQKLLLHSKRSDKSRKPDEPQGRGEDPQGDFLAQIDTLKQKDLTQDAKRTGVTKVSVSDSGDSEQQSERSTPSSKQPREKEKEAALEDEADYSTNKTPASPEENQEQHTKQRFANTIKDREFSIRQLSPTASDPISDEACEKCMQTIEEFDKHSKGSDHKRKELEARLQKTIDEVEHERNKTGTEGPHAQSQGGAAAEAPHGRRGLHSEARIAQATGGAKGRSKSPRRRTSGDHSPTKNAADTRTGNESSVAKSVRPNNILHIRGAANLRTCICGTRIRPHVHQNDEIHPKLHQAGPGNANPKSDV